MEQVTVFGCQQKNKPVDEPKQLREEAVRGAGLGAEGERAGGQALAQPRIPRALEEAVGQGEQGFAHIDGKVLESYFAGLDTRLPPALQGAIRDRSVGPAKARAVQQEPKQREGPMASNIGVMLCGRWSAQASWKVLYSAREANSCGRIP